MYDPRYTRRANIPSGSSLSSAVVCSGARPKGFLIPVGWTAANVTFEISIDRGATWRILYDGKGNEYSVLVGSKAGFYLLDPSAFDGITRLKIRSGTSVAPVAQAGARKINVVL